MAARLSAFAKQLSRLASADSIQNILADNPPKLKTKVLQRRRVIELHHKIVQMVSIRMAFLIILFLIPSTVLLAQIPVSVESSVDKQKVSQDEVVIFKVDITGELKAQPEIKLPDLKKDFEVVSTEQTQSFSVQKGKINREASFIYVLSAKAAGKFTIGEVEVVIGKESFKTASIDIEVTPAKNPRPKPPEQKPRIPPELESDEEQVIL